MPIDPPSPGAPEPPLPSVPDPAGPPELPRTLPVVEKWPRRVYLTGLFAPTIIVGLISLLLGWVSQHALPDAAGTIATIPSLFFLPFLDGMLAAWFWRSLRLGAGPITVQALVLTALDLIGATIVLREGVICLIIASPLLCGLIVAGCLLGRSLFNPDSNRLRVTILPLLLLGTVTEPFARAPTQGIVTDQVLIHAPAARVWPLVTSFPPIPEPPHFWLFKLGLPYPVETTSAGDFVGADRRCIFSGGAIFRESVARIEPGRELTFAINEIPSDPELLGHLRPEQGQFQLRDNGDGTTTLTGSTWYVLHVRPLWYFDWWTHRIFGAVHLRVMEDIKRRAELAPAPPGP